MAKEKKYHINRETGRPNLCEASVQDCPVGGEHYTDKAEAKKAGDAMMAERHKDNPFGTMSKKGKKNAPAAPAEEMAKHQDLEPEEEEQEEELQDLSEVPADAVEIPLEDPDAVKVSPAERAAFKNVMKYESGETEATEDDKEQLAEAFVNGIGYDTEEHISIDEYGDEQVIDVPTGDVKDISKKALVDSYYREVGQRMANPDEEMAAKRVISRVFEKHDMFESYNYTPVVEGNLDDEDEPPYVASFACHADTDAVISELKGIFNG